MNSSATMEAIRSKRACATTKTRGAPGRGTAGTTGPNGSAITIPSLLPGSPSWEVNRAVPHRARPPLLRVSGRARFDVLGLFETDQRSAARRRVDSTRPGRGLTSPVPLMAGWCAHTRPAAARTRRWTPGRRRPPPPTRGRQCRAAACSRRHARRDQCEIVRSQNSCCRSARSSAPRICRARCTAGAVAGSSVRASSRTACSTYPPAAENTPSGTAGSRTSCPASCPASSRPAIGSPPVWAERGRVSEGAGTPSGGWNAAGQADVARSTCACTAAMSRVRTCSRRWMRAGSGNAPGWENTRTCSRKTMRVGMDLIPAQAASSRSASVSTLAKITARIPKRHQFVQPGTVYRDVLSNTHRDHLVANIVVYAGKDVVTTDTKARVGELEPAGCHAPFLAPQPLRSARFPGRRFTSRNVPTHPSRDCRPKERAVTEPATHESALSALLPETRQFEPAPELTAAANAQPDIYARAAADPLGFWDQEARELTWTQPWEQVLEWEPPFAKWFVGGKLNVSVNCVDRHVEAGRGDKVAFYWEGEPEGDRRTALTGLRWLLGRGARRPHHRRRCPLRDHCGRRLPARRAQCAQADRRRRGEGVPGRGHGAGRPADRPGRRLAPGAGRLVARGGRPAAGDARAGGL